MANSTERECDFPSTVQFWFSVVTNGILILVGLTLQLFIVVSNVIDWLKGSSVTAADQIITSIGIARFFYLFTMPIHYFSFNCYADKYKICFIFSLFIGITSGFSSIWLSALLSIFFCFKISNFHSAFYLHLKTIIFQKVVLLIIASVLLGFGYTLMYLLIIQTLFKNSSYSDFLNDLINDQIIFSLNCLWNIFPLLLFFVSSFFLVISLGFHMTQMKGNRNAMNNTDAYRKVIMFTALSFLTCALCSIVNLTERYGMELFGFVWMCVFYYIFPILHSVFLIFVTSKLRNQFLRTVCCGTNCLFRRNASEAETREEVIRF